MSAFRQLVQTLGVPLCLDGGSRPEADIQPRYRSASTNAENAGDAWRRLQMVALEIRAPVRQNLLEPPVSQVGRGEFFRHIGQTDAVYCRIQDMYDAVENQLPFHLDGKWLACLFKLSCVDGPGSPMSDIDAGMPGQIMGRLRQRIPLKIGR